MKREPLIIIAGLGILGIIIVLIIYFVTKPNNSTKQNKQKTCYPLCINGKCDKKLGNCVCDDTWHGIDCNSQDPSSDKLICPQKCTSKENGTCDEKTGKCSCNVGFTKDDCSEIVCVPPCKN